MILLIVHGPPASGKLTVATEVARITGFPVFHNHVSFDLASTVFDYGSPQFADLIWDVRMSVFAHSARAKLSGLIFTWAYSSPEHHPYFLRVSRAANELSIELRCAYIACSADERRRRAGSKGRSAMGKIDSVAQLKKLEQGKNYQAITETTFVVDSTHVSPVEAARQIVDHFSLPQTAGAERCCP